ncbi:hypothetical protein [Devosia nitrariae]|uniref:Uncharacterized protein n=1 Tax=Devosia nitrariae TaxID=2071872 RepID=A0ABQ5W190_9HYPH|nr:hypothetical protein [Devosia nitrariae]GLQ53644.1 hypothetical protein GCM10010862_09030 [Devosia nitrariae]
MRDFDCIEELAFGTGRSARIPPHPPVRRQLLPRRMPAADSRRKTGARIDFNVNDTQISTFWLDLKILFTTLRHEFVAAD